jgi:hypothetical protein
MELQPTMNLTGNVAGEYGAIDRDTVVQQLMASYETLTRKFFECLDISNFNPVEAKFMRAVGMGTRCLLMN